MEIAVIVIGNQPLAYMEGHAGSFRDPKLKLVGLRQGSWAVEAKVKGAYRHSLACLPMHLF